MIHNTMTNNNKKLSILLFVLSTTMILGSSIDAYAAPSGDFEACLNAVGTVPCDTDGSGGSADEWNDGQITNEITYTEDQSIPARVDMTGLTGDGTTVHELEVYWHTTKASNDVSHTFDFITTFDNNDDPHPCLVAHDDSSDVICSGFGSDTIPIPDPTGNTNIGTVGGLSQPITGFTSLDTAEEQVFTMFAEGGTVDIQSIEYTLEEPPTGQATTQLKVTFTSTSTHVIAAYGAHLASPEDWELTSSQITGKPYQFGCVGVDGGSCTGKANLSSDGIVPLANPTVTIVKEVITLDGGNEGVDDFGLFVGASGSISSGTTVTISPDTDTSIGEAGLVGYTRTLGFAAGSSLECADTVNLPSNTNITCIIENDDDPASITLNVAVVGSTDTFTPTIDNGIVDEGVPIDVDSNISYTIDISESTTGFDVAITGDDDCTDSSITPDEGEAVVCDITLTAQQATIQVNVAVVGSTDTFTPTISPLGTVAEGTPIDVTHSIAHTVGISESTTGFDVAITGDDDCTDSSVTPDEGEAVVCDITLTAQQASVILNLTVSGGNEDVNDFTLRLGGNEVTDEVAELVAPNIAYTVNIDQTIVGYSVSLGGNGKCPDSLGGTVTPDEGETLTCTINLIASPAQITLEINLTTDDGGRETVGDFTLLLDGGSVTPGDQNSVPPNKIDIPINWSGPEGYTATISGDDECPDVLGGNVSPLDEGDAIICTISFNDITPTLKLIKELTKDNGGKENPGDWDLSAIATNDNARDFVASGNSDAFHEVFANDAYNLSESGPSNYIPNAWTCLDANNEGVTVVNDNVTLQVGDEVTCTINNDDIPPGLTLKMTLVNGIDGQATESGFVLSSDGPTGFFGNGPQTESGPDIVAGDYDLDASGPTSYSYGDWICSEDMVDFDTISISIGDAVLCSIVIEFIDNCPEVINPDQIDSDNDGTGDACESNGGMNHWDTRPSFGVSHETRETMVVDSGFTFNGNSFTVTDNHHTPFDEQAIQLGTLNTFEATVWADKDLKIQEFLFGVPEIGMGHLAEMRVEVWFDHAGEIEDIKVLQESEVIDRTSLSITHQKVKCQEKDTEEKCDKTSMSAVFLEPLADNVMAIKAMDFKLRDQTTYLNDGFDISGDSLNPMDTKMIASPAKGEGLIEVTQNEKYGNYWSTQDGRIFEMNSFGSFKQINQSFERFQDSGNAKTRLHSDFGKIVDYEANRAVKVFDASSLESELPDSFTHDITMSERLSTEMLEEMIIQEHIAQKVLDSMNQQTRWN